MYIVRIFKPSCPYWMAHNSTVALDDVHVVPCTVNEIKRTGNLEVKLVKRCHQKSLY